jgi:hypothetical protein
MDPPRPSLLKKRRRKGGALGRHAGGRKKKRQGSQTLVASFPGTSVTAASTVTIDQSLDCNVDNKDTVKPSDLPFIKHLRNRANYAERKCGTKTEQIKDLKASELVLKLAQINAQEVHDASIKQTQMEMAQTLKQSQKEMAQTLKQSQKVQNQLEKQLDKNETSANKVELQLEKKLLSSEASSFKVAKTLSTRAVRFATALSEEKEKNKVLKSSIKSIKSAIKSTAQTHKVTIQAQQRTIQAQQRTHKTKLNSEVEQVREEFSSVIRKTQVEFDEATVNAKGKARRHGDSVKTKAEAKVSRSQRTCAGLRGKLKVRTQLYYISFPCLKSASLSLY